MLAATGVFERGVSSCPLQYRNGNAPDRREVLGMLMLMLVLLAWHRRYAHISALRGDAVASEGWVRDVARLTAPTVVSRCGQVAGAHCGDHRRAESQTADGQQQLKRVGRHLNHKLRGSPG
ncbi:MAG: hypothetical protein ING89_18705 [Rubrivivax sp.]|nr:hypothetical protein [Rubrivivax sp.]